MKASLAASALALALLATGPAAAQSIDASDPARIVNLLQDMGYRATVEQTDKGEPRIRSASNGLNFSIWFYGCTNGAACRSLQFTTSWDMPQGMSAERAQEWNRKKRFAKMILLSGGDPALVYDIMMSDGMAVANLRASIRLWDALLGDFKEFVRS